MIGKTLDYALSVYKNKNIEVITIGECQKYDTEVVVRVTETADKVTIVCNRLLMKVKNETET